MSNYSKFTYHFETVPPWAEDVVKAAGVEYAKIVGPPAQQEFMPGVKIIGRNFLDEHVEAGYVRMGANGGRAYFEHMLPTYLASPYVHAWEAWNEPGLDNDADIDNLNAATVAWLECMHAHNMLGCGLMLGEGKPEAWQVERLRDAIEASDYLDVHEYDAPRVFDSGEWRLCRYRKTVAELRRLGARIPPILITECLIDGGIDGVDQPRTGWRTHARNFEDYVDQAGQYGAELEKDDYVEAAFIYTFGAWPLWANFDHTEGQARYLADLIRRDRETTPPAAPVVTPPAPEPEPEPDTDYSLRWPIDGPARISVEFSAEHPALDLASPKSWEYMNFHGTPVLAATDGAVYVDSKLGKYGLYVVLDNGIWRTYYAHLADAVGNGEHVSAGDIIGYVGYSGNAWSGKPNKSRMGARGTHVHFEVRPSDGQPDLDWHNGYNGRVNPVPFFVDAQIVA